MLRAFILAALLATPAMADPIELKVLTFNIWYGGDQVNFANVIKAIQLADADIVGLQEPDGKTLQIAALAGYPYADQRRRTARVEPGRGTFRQRAAACEQRRDVRMSPGMRYGRHVHAAAFLSSSSQS